MTTAPVLTTKNLSLTSGQSTLASSFLASVVAGARPITTYSVYDSGADGGYFMLNGQKQAVGKWITLTAAQFATLQYVAGPAGGAETLSFQAFNGLAWSPTVSATETTVTPAPVVTAKNATIDEGQTIAASALIGSITNPSGTTTTEYQFMDKGADGGKLELNGTVLTAGKWYTVTAAQLSQLSYVGGAGAGTDTISIESYNGKAWSSATTATVTMAPPPTVAANNPTIAAGQTIAGSSLIGSVTDPAGAAITEYAFMDSGADGGHLVLNGTVLTSGKWYDLTPAQLAQLSYIGGAGAGTDTVSIQAFDGHVWSNVATAKITETAPGILGKLTDSGIEGDVAKLMVNNSLSYNSMLTILQDAAAGGMNASKFSTLQTLDSLLNATGGISTSTYVKDLANSVIAGDGANATWTGGASSSVALGNLTATSSQTQVTELIGKWFLGTDLPSFNVASIGESNLGDTYKMTTNALYGSTGAPTYSDVNQGYDGDCYFLSSLAEVALMDPTGIESMITNNGNGTYGVRFEVNGQADYVNVNNALPTMPSGYSYADGSNLAFANGSIAWPELLEKAYAELNAEPNAPHGGDLNAAVNSYAGISGGSAYALTEITGQAVNGFGLSKSTSAATLASDNTQLGAAFSAKQELLVATSGATTGNLVSDHMFEVTGYNAATDTLTLHNPWGSSYSGPLAMTFTETLSQLAANNCTVFATTGKAIA